MMIWGFVFGWRYVVFALGVAVVILGLVYALFPALFVVSQSDPVVECSRLCEGAGRGYSGFERDGGVVVCRCVGDVFSYEGDVEPREWLLNVTLPI